MNNNVEINIILKDYKHSLNLPYIATIQELKEKIRLDLQIKQKEYELYCEKYMIDDILKEYSIGQLIENLKSNKLKIVLNSESSYFDEEYDNIDENVISKLTEEYNDTEKSKNTLLKENKYTIKLLNEKFAQIAERVKEYEAVKKIIETQDKNNAKILLERNQIIIEDYKKEIDEKKVFLYDYCMRILELKKQEKYAIENVLQNKKLVGDIHKNNIMIKKKLNIIKNLEEVL